MAPLLNRFKILTRYRLGLLGATSAAASVASYLYLSTKEKKTSLFSKDARRPLDPEPGHEARAIRLTRQFSTDALPDKFDAIVIGSGIGGLSSAAILSKTGRKVLVLERHWRAGGRCSSFLTGSGHEFDVGIHYVGHMGPSNYTRFLLDQITDGQVDWQKLPDDYDHVVYKKPSGEKVVVPIWEDAPRFLNEFLKRYPEQEKGLREFVARMVKNDTSGDEERFWPAMKLIPIWLANAISNFGIYKVLTSSVTGYRDITTKNELDRLFGKEDSELKGILTYPLGNGHILPETSGREMMYALYSHFLNGSYFPVGGGNKIPYSLIGTIEKAGGQVLVDAHVSEILLDKNNNKVTGVRVLTSSGPVDIKAPIVISNAGVANTFRKMLPKDVASKTAVGKLLDSGRIHPGGAFFKVYIGLKGSQAELNLPARNLWFIFDENYERAVSEWGRLGFKKAAESGTPPVLFVNFASAKDPTYNDRSPGVSVCEIITSGPVEWFGKWEGQHARSRDEDYQEAKMKMARRCWQHVAEYYPNLAEKVDFIDAATALTFKSYVNAYGGEPYGLDHDGERFSPDVVAALRPKVPEIEGLYLTGQDVLMCGIGSSLTSAFLTCQTILQPLGECGNLLLEMEHRLKEFGPNKTAPQSSPQTKKN